MEAKLPVERFRTDRYRIVAILIGWVFHALFAGVAAAQTAPNKSATANSDAETKSEATAPLTDSESANRTDSNKSGQANFSRREALLASLTVFVLAVFLGFELITKVPPTLHTPLMSGSNAISGITIVGALLAAGTQTTSRLIPLLGFLAVVMATINCVGGFAVTHRMLSMFQRK